MSPSTRRRVAVGAVALLVALVVGWRSAADPVIAGPTGGPVVEGRGSPPASASPAPPAVAEPPVASDFHAFVSCPLPPGPEEVPVSATALPGGPFVGTRSIARGGRFTLAVSAPDGAASVKVEGYAPTVVRWEGAPSGGRGTCLPPVWTRVTAGVVIGRATGRGAIPDGATVQGCGAGSAPIDPDGTFYLEAASSEPCDLAVSWTQGRGVFVKGQPLEVDPSEAETDVELPAEAAEVHLSSWLGEEDRSVTLRLEPEGLRIRYATLTTHHADGRMDVAVTDHPEAGTLITSVDGAPTAAPPEAQVELAARLLGADTPFTVE